MTKIIGTYKIINKKTQKYYYGSSKNIYVRIIQHKSQLKNNKHHCVYLQNSYNKYGKKGPKTVCSVKLIHKKSN